VGDNTKICLKRNTVKENMLAAHVLRTRCCDGHN
jgi:hypothetical protein